MHVFSTSPAEPASPWVCAVHGTTRDGTNATTRTTRTCICSTGTVSSQYSLPSRQWAPWATSGVKPGEEPRSCYPYNLPWHLFLLIGALLMVSLAIAFLLPRFSEKTPRRDVSLESPAGVFHGIVVQARNEGNVYAFLGISYAIAPLGSLRFGAPVLLHHASSVVDATKKREPCVQAPPLSAIPHAGAIGKEDCLHLNVWTPTLYCSGRSSEDQCGSKTVLVLFFGDEFEYGGNAVPAADGRFLAAFGDMVVVVPNYRQGVFGFLDVSSNQRAPGNVGLLDQVVALQWVVQNVASFGGNLSRIILAGYNAGAASVGYLLLGHASHIRRVVLLGATPLTRFAENTVHGQTTARHLARRLCCDRWKCPLMGDVPTDVTAADIVNCLRYVRVRELSDEAAAMVRKSWLGFGPTFNKDPVYGNPFTGRGHIAPPGIHVLMGITAGEGAYTMSRLMSLLGTEMSIHNLVLLLGGFLEQHYGFWDGPGAVSLFVPSAANVTKDELMDTVQDLLAHLFYFCPIRYYARALEEREGRASVFVFWPRPSFRIWDLPGTNAAVRFDDLSFLMGLPLAGATALSATADEKQLSLELLRALVGFINHGTLPVVGDQPWPPFSGDDQAVHVQIQNITLGPLPGKSRCTDLYRHIMGNGIHVPGANATA